MPVFLSKVGKDRESYWRVCSPTFCLQSLWFKNHIMILVKTRCKAYLATEKLSGSITGYSGLYLQQISSNFFLSQIHYLIFAFWNCSAIKKFRAHWNFQTILQEEFRVQITFTKYVCQLFKEYSPALQRKLYPFLVKSRFYYQGPISKHRH